MRDLGRFGPGGALPHLTQEQAFDYCKSLAKQHYENFSVASWLVPRSLRQDLYNVYAFCRWSDDLGDEVGDKTRSLELLQWWRIELEKCFQGESIHPVFIALKSTVDRFRLESLPFKQLVDAFVQDQTVFRYATDTDLDQYCSKSANPVGRIMLGMAGVHSDQAKKLSDCVCTGLQIANFCQDMKRDAWMGRIYLPQSRWAQHQLTESAILRAEPTQELRTALLNWLQVARQSLVHGIELSRLGPRWLARDVQLFARGGLTILDNIQRAKCDVWSQSIEVTKKQKIALILRALIWPRSSQVRNATLQGLSTSE